MLYISLRSISVRRVLKSRYARLVCVGWWKMLYISLRSISLRISLRSISLRISLRSISWVISLRSISTLNQLPGTVNQWTNENQSTHTHTQTLFFGRSPLENELRSNKKYAVFTLVILINLRTTQYACLWILRILSTTQYFRLVDIDYIKEYAVYSGGGYCLY